MAILPIEELEKKVGSRYALTVLAGKRARELRDGAPQLVNADSSNPILIALQEIYEGKIVADNLDYTAEEPTPVAAKDAAADDDADSPLAGADIADLTDANAAGVELPGSVDITGAPTDESTLEISGDTADGGSIAAPEDAVQDDASEAVAGDGDVSGADVAEADVAVSDDVATVDDTITTVDETVETVEES